MVCFFDLRHWHILLNRNLFSGIGHDVKIRFVAHKERLCREQLKVVEKNNSSVSATLVFHARVLGKFKVTISASFPSISNIFL